MRRRGQGEIEGQGWAEEQCVHRTRQQTAAECARQQTYRGLAIWRRRACAHGTGGSVHRPLSLALPLSLAWPWLDPQAPTRLDRGTCRMPVPALACGARQRRRHGCHAPVAPRRRAPLAACRVVIRVWQKLVRGWEGEGRFQEAPESPAHAMGMSLPSMLAPAPARPRRSAARECDCCASGMAGARSRPASLALAAGN